MRWEFHEANIDFSKLLRAALKNGPQVIMCGGVEVAALVPFELWRRLHGAAHPRLKELLLGPEGRTEKRDLKRRALRRRDPVEFK